MQNNENIIEVPYTEVETEEVSTESKENEILDLQDVGYMVMVGRKKDGETFFRTVNINDLIVIQGLVDFAQREIDDTYAAYFEDISRKSKEQL